MSIAAIALAALAALAQDTLEFKGTGWVNSKDLHLERLRGKVVVLYFFEEG
jgi:hypothetical protein